jgi:hypothetical protein
MPSSSPVTVEINDYSEEIDPGQFTSVSLPEGALKQQNDLRLSGNGSYTVRNLKVVSQRSEE